MKYRKTLLCAYDLMLSAGAFYAGILMISARSQMFKTYPSEWLNRTPFHSWMVPGIIFLLFGIANVIAFAAGLIKKERKTWVLSALISMAFLFCLIVQIIMLRDWYLATVELMLLSILQLVLSLYAAGSRENENIYYNRRMN